MMADLICNNGSNNVLKAQEIKNLGGENVLSASNLLVNNNNVGGGENVKSASNVVHEESISAKKRKAGVENPIALEPNKAVKTENGQSASEKSVIVASGPVKEGNVRKRRPGRRWTQAEDEVLRSLVTENGNRHWKKIAKDFARLSGSERSDVQCLHRWNKCLKPGLVKGPWTVDEDTKIKEMIKENGGPQNVRWSVIAKQLPGRLGKQVRERWINHLDPTIVKTEWTTEEDDNLYELQKRFGNRWKWIAELMPGRSENGVKNRWHSIKPTLLARKQQENGSNQQGGKTKDDAQTTAKTAVAAAVAASISATKKRATRKRKTKQEQTNKNIVSSSPTSRNPSIADLLTVGQTLAAGEALQQSTDLQMVAEKAKELLRMSESYREMAKVILGNSNPSSPNFNAHLQREISNQLSKQLPTPVAPTLPFPTNILTNSNSFLDQSNKTSPGASPLSNDPLLFSNYFKTFTTSMNLNDGSCSPTQMLSAVAAQMANLPQQQPKNTQQQ